MNRLALTMGTVALALGCTKGQAPVALNPGPNPGAGSEWVNYQVEVGVDAGDFTGLASSLFGPAAQAGQRATNVSVNQAFYVTSEADPSTPDQARLTLAFNDGTANPRTLAVAPASYALGKIFLDTVNAAIAQMQADVASNNAGGEIFNLAYRVTSTQGGTLSLALNGSQGAYTLALDVTSPHTTLQAGQVGLAASSEGPTDSVSGTVWFQMTQDEFDYFVSHAYGQGATAGQNFNDFALVPYTWLRLTVTPQISANLVDVGFEVLTPSGARIPVAKAPASVMAGSTFQALVDRQMITMAAQEKTAAGSSMPWTVPFYYDQPAGGGVVQVIAQGQKGVYSVAYSIASPQHVLKEVPFVPYKSVTFPPPDPNASKPCDQLGLPNVTQALQGVFQITFSASSVIKNDLPAGQQLVGDIGCSIFHASDVTVTGPSATAKSLEDFTVPGANLLGTPAPTFTTHNALADGNYQILCAQYIDGNPAQVSKGDPVTLPIGAYQVGCNLNPVNVEFAILNPSTH